jgi:hypothetical protein
VVIWYIFPVLVCLDQQKSGNPDPGCVIWRSGRTCFISVWLTHVISLSSPPSSMSSISSSICEHGLKTGRKQKMEFANFYSGSVVHTCKGLFTQSVNFVLRCVVRCCATRLKRILNVCHVALRNTEQHENHRLCKQTLKMYPKA